MKSITILMSLFLLFLNLHAYTKRSEEKTDNSKKNLQVIIDFSIQQDIELIRQSIFGEPPQFAIWLEEPETHKLKTVFVTYRAGSGDWVGKVECPAALPRWFEVFEEEFDYAGFPNLLYPVPDAITGATLQVESIKSSVQVNFGSSWIYWVEMNLSGDFNNFYKDHDIEKRLVDVDLSGQPALIYRGEIKAVPGEMDLPVLYGQTLPYDPGQKTIQPVSSNITTATSVFNKIEVSVNQIQKNN